MICAGIRDSRCFVAIAPAVIAMRPWDCWCFACRRAERRNVGMDSFCCVSHCEQRATTPFVEMSVRRLDAAGIAANRYKSQEIGHGIVSTLRIGDIIAAQNTGHEDYDDQYWIGVVLDSGNGRAWIRQVEMRAETIDGVGFNRGDFAMSVHWFHRDACDADRLTFYQGKIVPRVVNSCSLRKVVHKTDEWKKRPQPPQPRYRRSKRVHVTQQPNDEVLAETQRWLLDCQAEEDILNNCHYNA